MSFSERIQLKYQEQSTKYVLSEYHHFAALSSAMHPLRYASVFLRGKAHD